MKNKKIGRRVALASTLLALSGCASGGPSWASLNPFGKHSADGNIASNTISPDSSMPGAPPAFAQGTQGQISSMGSAVKSAYAKTTDSVAGIFKGKADTVDGAGNTIDADDPLRLDKEPQSIGPEVFVANGQLWESTGNFEKAMENYAKALETEPRNAPALGSIARLNFRQAKHAEAVDYFERAIEAAPNDAALYNDLGLTLSKMKRHQEAAKAIQSALAIAPGTSRYANNLASVHYAAGRSEQAMKTLAEHNKPAVAHFNMAYLEFNDGNYDAAREQLTEALRYEPQASDDSAIRRAVERSRELLAKLDRGSMQVAKIAQAAPQAYKAAQRLQETGKQVVRTTGESYSMSDDNTAADSGATSPSAEAAKQNVSESEKPEETSTESAKPTASHPFALPANFFQSAETSNEASEE